MFYEFIHPITSHREVFDTKNDAENYLQIEINKYIKTLITNKYTAQINYEINCGKQFLANKSYDCDLVYEHTILNVDNNENLGRVYFCKANSKTLFVKIKNDAVIEYYIQEAFDNYYVAQSFDLNTSEPLEIYRWLDANLQEIPFESVNFDLQKLMSTSVVLGKFDLNRNLLATTNMNASYDDMPIDKQELLKNWEYKNKIINIKQQTYGYVVHYIENVFEPMTDEKNQEYAKSAGFCIKEVC